MKKLFFSFVMLVTLVIVAGSAKAQKNNTPFQGGTYTYTLSGITVISASTATVTYTGGSGATIDTPTIPISTGANQSITFHITYSDNASSGVLKVDIGDNSTGCHNFIQLDIQVQNKPTIDLAITTSASAEICQNLNTSPTDNKDASIGASANTFIFTVTPNIGNKPAEGTYTYNYTLAIPNAATTGLTGYTIARTTGTGTWTESNGTVVGATTTTPEVYTITFTTTTGLDAKTINGLLSGVTLHTTSGNGTYGEIVTNNNSSTVKVNSTPKIGTFTIE